MTDVEKVARAIWETWRASDIAPEFYRDFAWEELRDLGTKYPAPLAPGKMLDLAMAEAQAALAAMGGEAEPVAWMRRWAADKVDVMALKKADRPGGWHLHATTEAKLLADDVPLYAHPPRSAVEEAEEPLHYPITLAWSEEDEAWIATSPDLPGCTAVGDTKAEALREMQDAMLAWLGAMRSAGNPIPKAALATFEPWTRREAVAYSVMRRASLMEDEGRDTDYGIFATSKEAELEIVRLCADGFFKADDFYLSPIVRSPAIRGKKQRP